MRTGEELKTKLGLGAMKYTPCIKIMNTSGLTFLVVFYDTLRPDVPITTYDIRSYIKCISVQRYPFGKEAPSGPVERLEDTNYQLNSMMVCAVDLSGRYGNRDKQIRKTESIERRSIKLNEWLTFKDLNTLDSISDFTKKHRDIRDKVVKTENWTAKLVGCEYDKSNDSVTFDFKTEATTPIYPPNNKFKKVDPSNMAMHDNPQKSYNMKFKILEFMKWLKDTRPDSMKDEPITWSEVKAVINVAYVQVWCDCPSFQYQGINYWLGQLDGSIYPTDIEPKRWNAPNLHGDGNAFLCKHTWGLVRQIGFFGNQMASMLNKQLKQKGLI